MNIKNRLLLAIYIPIFALSTLCNTGCGKTDVGALRCANSAEDWDGINTDEDFLPETPLTIDNILEIVLTRNLDILAQEHELAVQSETAKAQRLAMLPPLTLDGIFSSRSENTASLTKILNSPVPVTQAQLSSLRETRQWDIRDKMNLIDFGIAYFKSRQEKTRTLLVDQQHLRLRQKLILDTIESYWKAITAFKAIKDAEDIIAFSKKIQASLQKQIVLRTISKIQGLQTESRLAEAAIQLHAVQYQFDSAKVELAGFMGLPPGMTFEIADVELSDEDIPIWDIQSLEEQALLSRPELSVKDLEEKIARESVRMAILQMFPNAALFMDYNRDGNPFLAFQHWMSAGVQATWNLFNIPEQWHFKNAAQEQEQQAYRSRLALSIAVITQVHLAYLGYYDAVTQYRLANRAYDVKQQLADAAKREREIGEFNSADFLNFASDALLAKLIALKAYGNLQVAIEQLNYAVGTPLLFGHVDIYGVPVGVCEVIEGEDEEEVLDRESP